MVGHSKLSAGGSMFLFWGACRVQGQSGLATCASLQAAFRWLGLEAWCFALHLAV